MATIDRNTTLTWLRRASWVALSSVALLIVGALPANADQRSGELICSAPSMIRVNSNTTKLAAKPKFWVTHSVGAQSQTWILPGNQSWRSAQTAGTWKVLTSTTGKINSAGASCSTN